MNGTGSLLQKSAAFLWRNPILLLPVLLVRVLDFAGYWLFGLLKGPAVKAVAPRSVLGGLSGKVSSPVVAVAAFFTLLPLVIEVGLLIYGMAVAGRWTHALREEQRSSDESDGEEPIGARSWRAPAAEVLRVAALTLAIGGITAFVGLYFTLRGGVPAQWAYVVTWCFLIMAAWFLIPVWLRLLAGVQGVRQRDVSRVPPFVATAIAFVVYATCIFLAGDVQHQLDLAHRIHGAALPFFINLAAACVSAIPLAFCFVALSRYVAERPGWQAE